MCVCVCVCVCVCALTVLYGRHTVHGVGGHQRGGQRLQSPHDVGVPAARSELDWP